MLVACVSRTLMDVALMILTMKLEEKSVTAYTSHVVHGYQYDTINDRSSIGLLGTASFAIENKKLTRQFLARASS